MAAVDFFCRCRNMPDNRLLIAAGGTGGHLYPALAVAERYRQLVDNPEVTFVGTERGLESRIVPKAGFPLEYVRAAPLRVARSRGSSRACGGSCRGWATPSSS